MPTMSHVRDSIDIPMDVQEYQTFVEENLSLIYRYMYSKVGNREDAEDLTSQIFLKVVSKIDLSHSRQRVQQWLFLIARTTIADYWRDHYRHPSSSLDELLDVGWEVTMREEAIATNSYATDRVQRLLRALPQRYREVLHCRFLLNKCLVLLHIHGNIDAISYMRQCWHLYLISFQIFSFLTAKV